ncbi:hypothetical protein [Bacillus mycoides]|uniref:hypothetical protein n=1 Tax=Bacillus mycoides TaxID=1405 RepID=UPI000BF25C9A|nr:hypothetical protein [Bacillus mycoides]PGA03599.1 hypothetical protein COL71_28960 [Bacillus mycoides]
MNDLIKDIIYSSIMNLFKNQTEIFENTDQTNLTEWNLSHHLSNEIKKYIFWLDYDLDVTKRNYRNNRPDIIFHRRQVNTFNFLVVELKKSRYDNQSDVKKIKEDWMSEPLNYRFGAYINIWGVGKYKAILFEKDGKKSDVNELCNYIHVPNLSNEVLLQYKELIDGSKSINNDIELMKNLSLIDSQIYNIYAKDNSYLTLK